MKIIINTPQKVSIYVANLVQKMTSSIENLFEDFVMIKNVAEDLINGFHQKKSLRGE